MDNFIKKLQTIKGKSFILIAISFLIYSNTLKNGFVLDDDVVYLKNRYVQSGTDGIRDIFSHGFLHGFNGKNDQSYRPLVLFNFAIEHEFFGNNPKVHHFFNLLFYGLTCFLIFKLLLLLFNDQEKWLAFWISLLFTVHPIHTEVVSNIKGRDDLLHVVFYILTFIYGIKYLDLKKKKYLIFSLISLFFAALCKEIAVTAIALFPITIYVFRNYTIRDSIKKGAYLLLPLGLYFLIRNQILDTIAFEEKMSVINNGIVAGNNFQEQLGITFSIFAKYIQLLFYPNALSWDYSYPYFPIVSVFNSKILIFVCLIISLVVWSVYAVVKERNRIAFGVLFFIITFSIVSNFFILIGATLGERFLFLPSVGFSILLIFLLNILYKNLGAKNENLKKIVAYSVIGISLFFSYTTYDRNKDWESNETLFESGYYATPTSSRSVLAFASVFRERGELSVDPNFRISNFNKAIELYKESIGLFDEVADSWYNLGISYAGVNQINLAKQAYERALHIDPKNISAANNLGVMYFQEKDYPNAKKYFNLCLQINPNFGSALANLGAVNHNLGNLQEAKKFYIRALEINPNDQNTRNNLSKL